MATTYYSTIGLEIHAELKTVTKMFCRCKNDPDETKPNINICPVCMAHPGALPVLNKKAIEHAVRVGLALGGEIALDFTEFDRKNYFYPDIPKGYQISQYKYPIVQGGELAGFKLTRVHLEEDTANSKHDRGDYSLIDFNRAGVPLMELVTEPHTYESAEEAGSAASRFAKEYQLLLRYLDVSEANMEKGEMRVEANISLSRTKGDLGTKVEVKNLNSFRSAERAIKYELDRMQKLHDDGKDKEIVQETRGWDEGKQSTFSQRSKENAQDYRYFPDPDLPKLKLSEVFDVKALEEELPELPEEKRVRYAKLGLNSGTNNVLVEDIELTKYIDQLIYDVKGHSDWKDEYYPIVANFLASDLINLRNTLPEFKFPKPINMTRLIIMYATGAINSRVAKDLLAMIVLKDESPMKLVEEKGLSQKHDKNELTEIIKRVIDENPKVVADYKSGKQNALMSLVGAVMKETKGSANPEMTRKLFLELLD